MDTVPNLQFKFLRLLYLVVFLSLVSLIFASPLHASDDFNITNPGVQEHTGDIQDQVTLSNSMIMDLIERIERNPSDVDFWGPPLEQLARSYISSGDFRRAERVLRSIYRAQRKISSDDKPLYFRTLARLTNFYLKKQDFDACIENHDFLKTGHETIGVLSKAFMWSTLNAVECELRRGDTNAAWDIYSSYSHLRTKYNEQLEKIIGKEVHAYGRWMLGKIALQSQFDNQAEELLLETLGLFEDIVGNDPMAGVISIEGTQHMPLVLADISRLYSRQGRFTESKEFMERATGLGLKVFSKSDIDWWDLYLAGGNYYENLGDLSSANTYYLKAAKVLPIYELFDSPWMISIAEPQARVAYATGDYDKAELLYDGLLMMHRINTGRESYPYASTLKNLALVYAGNKEFDFALITLTAGKMIAEMVLPEKDERLVPFLLSEAMIRTQMGELDNAKALTLEADSLTLLDTVLSKASNPRRKEIQSRMMAILNAKHGARHVYTPNDLLTLNPGGLFKITLAADSDLGKNYERWEGLSQELENIKALLKRELTTEASKRDQNRERGLLQRKEQLLIQSEQLYESLKSAIPQQNLAENFANYQSKLEDDEALLAYQLDDEQMTIVLVKNDGIRLVPSPGNMKRVKVLVERIMRTLDQRNVKKRSELLSFDADAAWELYKIAFQPAEKWLNNTNKIFTVRSGALQRVPMGLMLRNSPSQKQIDADNKQWLIDNYVFVEIPDMAYLRSTKEAIWSGTNRFAGFGHPQFKGEDTYFSSLPNTVTELLAVAEQLETSFDEVRIGEQFTRENLLKIDLSAYDILSFSTHALTAEQASRLQLGTDAGILASTVDASRLGSGYITASTIRDLQLRARLVMLAACNTGAIDEFYAAASMSQLAESFLDAGAQSVLVSMWSVDSTVATLVISRMFDILSTGKASSYADALRQAAIWLRDNKELNYNQHPTFWGPFTLINDLKLVQKHETSNVSLAH